MRRTIKARLREWAPPILLRVVRRSSSAGVRFSKEFETWEEALDASGGYDDAAILQKVMNATLKVKRGEAVYERDSMIFDEVQYSWPVVTGLMWAAAQDGGRVRVMDFGGSLGSSYFENRNFLDGLPDVRWGIVEQPHYVSSGREHIAGDRLTFHETIEECGRAIAPNAVLLSSVLQYVRDPEAIVRDVTALEPTVIVVDRTIVNAGRKKATYVQHVPAAIYSASYPVCSLPEGALVATFAGAGYTLETEFESLPFPALDAISSRFKGYIFSKINRA